MVKIVVSRDDDLYEAFADIAQTPTGVLVCTYREAMAHAPWPFSRIVIRRSTDGGYSWHPKIVLLEKNLDNGQGALNCSRIACLNDGSLLLIVDWILPKRAEGDTDPAQNLIFRSTDDGATWQGPQETGITDGIVPSIKELSNGDLLIGVTRTRQPKGMDWRQGLAHRTEEQTVYRSADGGRTWDGPAIVPGSPELKLNEGDFAELDDGAIALYMREDKEGLSGWKSLSHDSGKTWTHPVRTEMLSCRGRPSVGRLRSGEILITYRFCSGVSTSLALYMETPKETVRTEPLDPSKYDTEYSEARFAFIDNDRSIHPDSGYSGWVQLPNGNLYVVNYVTDDAPRAQIRGYILTREDFFLCPEPISGLHLLARLTRLLTVCGGALLPLCLALGLGLRCHVACFPL